MIRRLFTHVALLSSPSTALFTSHHLNLTMPRRSARLQGHQPSTTTSTRSVLPQKRSADHTNDHTNDDYNSMKVVELRELLKQRRLPVSGVKADLIGRLLDSESVAAAGADGANDKPKRSRATIKKSNSSKSNSSSTTATADTYCLPRTVEHRLQSNNSSLQIIGVDEAGRGPLAGPVVAAAAIVPTNIAGIIDSKKITKEEERERLYEELIESKDIRYAVAVVSAQRIDEINILQATLEGMRMAVEGVMGLRSSGENNVVSTKRREISYIVTGGVDVVQSSSTTSDETTTTASYHALIDGNRLPKDMPCPSESLTKGDGREYSIGAASILAKVTRDRLMHDYDKLYPEYNLSQHKGYPTAAHMSAVRKFGASQIHRRTFAPLKHWEFDSDGKIVGEKKKETS